MAVSTKLGGGVKEKLNSEAGDYQSTQHSLFSNVSGCIFVCVCVHVCVCGGGGGDDDLRIQSRDELPNGGDLKEPVSTSLLARFRHLVRSEVL